jgi:hypothetical protein
VPRATMVLNEPQYFFCSLSPRPDYTDHAPESNVAGNHGIDPIPLLSVPAFRGPDN